MKNNKIIYQFAYPISKYAEFDRVKVAYIKNGEEQVATFMNFSLDGGRNFKLIEDIHFPYNRLTSKEQKEMGEALNNYEIGMVNIYDGTSRKMSAMLKDN